MAKPLVCLTMIVKNEEAVLARCLEKVKPFIDMWVIVDTGSTDKTQEVVRRAMQGIPGQFVTHEWKGFGDARTRSLVVAEQLTVGRPAYAWVVDADEIWEGKLDASLLTKEGHGVWVIQPGQEYYLKDGMRTSSYVEGAQRAIQQPSRWVTARFLKLGIGWRYEGVVHENPICAIPAHVPFLDGIVVTSPNDGFASSDPDKHLKRAKAISKELVEDPTNSRYVFYLAQSYRDYGDLEKAAMLYMQRSAMGPGTNPEEVYVSLLEAGRALSRLDRREEARTALLAAHNHSPRRREAMWELGELLLIQAAISADYGSAFVEEFPRSFRLTVDTEAGPVTVVNVGYQP